MKVELADDQYAIIRGADTVRNRERRMASRATDAQDGPVAKDQVYVDTMIALLLEEWTLPLPCPTAELDERRRVLTENFDSFDEMSSVDYDALRNAALGVYAEARGLVVEPDDNTDPTTPTEPLGD